MGFVRMSDITAALDTTPTRPRRRNNWGVGDMGSSKGALQFAMAQTAQIKQALQSGDPITAVSIAAGNPWTTKPSPAQVEAMLANPQQGAQILQKLYDSLQGPGYRSPLPGTMPIDQLRSSLAQYLSQITPPAAPTPTKAAQQGTINVVTTAPVQSFVQSILPANMAVPPPVKATAPAPAPTPAPAPAAPAEDPNVTLAKKQLDDLMAQQAAGRIRIYRMPPEGCPAGFETRALAEGTKLCIEDLTKPPPAPAPTPVVVAPPAPAPSTPYVDPYLAPLPPPPVAAPPVYAPPAAPTYTPSGGSGFDYSSMPTDEYATGGEEQAPPPPPPPPPPSGPAPVWYLVGGLAVIGGGFAIWYFTRKKPDAAVVPAPVTPPAPPAG